ncbi:MAG: cell shape determination protein CcmA [Gammaproteobacteria bacterium]|nr:cell shape determination protein CcmA [Gammaproteobacteria bacterium]MAY03018.1 cell shape determination protein CcmA [Gammaproteobacteria bacterium]
MKNKFSENVTTLISKSTEIIGDLNFSGTLEVEGKIKGNIYANPDAPAEIRIRENGFVQGEIKVPSIIINGMVEGDVYSSDHIELAAKARVVGNVYYNLIEMVMGSEVNGSLLHRSPEELKPKKLEKPTVVSSERDSVVVEAAAKASS